MKQEQEFSIAFTRHRNWKWKCLETAIITSFALFISYFFRSEDPFFLRGPMPWLAFLPAFCSLFYGAIYGIGSLILVLACFFSKYPILNLIDDTIVQQYVVGSVVFTLLTTVFSSYWVARIYHVEYLNQYLWEHLEALSKEYYLLRLSHERLEQAYIVKPLSIRDVFYRIGLAMRKAKEGINEEAGKMLLGIFSQYCSINNAALCLFNEQKSAATPLVFLGGDFSIDLDDPLIQLVIKEKNSHYVAVNRLNKSNDSDYIAVIPLLSSSKNVIGFVVIRDMAFWCLSHDNLEVLSVFAAYFSLQWSKNNSTKQLAERFDDCPLLFLQEFQTLVGLKKRFNMDHVLACVIIPEGIQQNNIVHTIQRTNRTLDYEWLTAVKSYKAIITLMPFTGLEGLSGYKSRIDKLLKNDFGLGLNTNGIMFRSRSLEGTDAQFQLEEFMKEIDHAITS